MTLRLAFNTNGTPHHRLDDALSFLADSGYDGVALTLDIHHLDPFAPDFPAARRALAARLRALGLGCVVETGARFLLDPRAKHEPTLVTADPEGRARRVEFLSRALEVAAETGAEAMSFWAGVPRPGVTSEQARGWVLEGVERVVRRAEALGATAALEPEPGMAIETVGDWRPVAAAVPGLRLALDVGHCHVTGDMEAADAVRRHHAEAATVSIEDMRRGVHVHLPFGEGDMDLPAVIGALQRGGVPAPGVRGAVARRAPGGPGGAGRAALAAGARGVRAASREAPPGVRGPTAPAGPGQSPGLPSLLFGDTRP